MASKIYQYINIWFCSTVLIFSASIIQFDQLNTSYASGDAGTSDQSLIVPISGLPGDDQQTTLQDNSPFTNQKVGLYESPRDTFGVEPEAIAFQNFVGSVQNGNSSQVRGVYVNGVMALSVVQQPDGNPGYVSGEEGVVTEFRMARSHNVTGLLAHNYLSGRTFFNLMIGDHVDVVYGDGVVQSYVVSNIIRYQAMQPYSPNSTFVNLDTNEQLSANNLFYQVYSGSHHLTLQTCIQEGVVDSWGRLFIIAEPVDAGQLASLPNS